jgi:hypothetical protein
MGYRPLWRSALLFAAIGLVIYAGLYHACERLLYQTGKSNPFYKIETADRATYDWVILGASHAMTLGFDDVNDWIEGETGLHILNLASPGTGPLYNRFVFEHFLRDHRTKRLLYVVDSFGFYSPKWNEERFADTKLIRGTPFVPKLAWSFLGYSIEHGVDPRAALDYVTGFSKINNRERFKQDIWEGEAQFDRVHRPSSTADNKRIEYLYPDTFDAALFERYLGAFKALISLARRSGVDMAVIKMPVPARFHAKLPEEASFDEKVSHMLAASGVPFHDFSLVMDEARFYFDTDHLNHEGLTEFFNRYLKEIMTAKRNGKPR